MPPPSVPPPSVAFLTSRPRSPWQRYAFLSISAASVVAIVVVGHEVMLPFVLAIVIAFVLLPLVEWVERYRVPRAAAILIVYAVVLGAMASFVRAAAPRVGMELGGLRRELPTLGDELRDKWVPRLREQLDSLGMHEAATALAPPPVVADAPPSALAPRSAIIARPQPDGSLSINIGTGFNVTQTNYGFLVEPVRQHRTEGFDPNKLVADAIQKTVQYAQENALELARVGRDVVRSIGRVIFVFFITLMLAAYIMLTHERIYRFFLGLVRPSARPSFEQLFARIDKGLSGVVRGQLIICLVNGVLSAIGFAVVGLKYWPVLALVATVFSLIPIFGAIISSVPAVLLGLTQSFGTAMFVLAWIVAIHQLEANLLNPKIMGDQAKIHPVLVIFALLFGEHFFHIVGALLAVPCMSLAQSVFIHFRGVVQSRDVEMASEPYSVSMLPPEPTDVGPPSSWGGGRPA